MKSIFKRIRKNRQNHAILKVEELGSRCLPCTYTVSVDATEYFAERDDDPGGQPLLPVNTWDIAGNQGVPTPTYIGAPGQPGFTSIEDVKTELKKDATAKKLLDDFIKDGGKIVSSAEPRGGGAYNPKTLVIELNPLKTDPVSNNATGVLLYELLRHKYWQEYLDNDKKAKDGTISKEDYVLTEERLTYKIIKENHEIAKKAVSDGNYGKHVDRFKDRLDGDFSTFEKFLDVMKKTGHYEDNERRYDFLRYGKTSTEVDVPDNDNIAFLHCATQS